MINTFKPELISEFLGSYYCAPFWAAGAAKLSHCAYKSYKELIEGRSTFLSALGWSAACGYPLGMTIRCIADGLEKLL